MATLTQTHVLVCDSESEFLAFVAQLDAYEDDESNPQLSSRVDDVNNKTITYSWSGAKNPSS